MNTRKTPAAAALIVATLAAGHAAAADTVRTVDLPEATERGADVSDDTISVTTNSSAAIVSAQAVALLSTHGKYMTCDDGGGGDADIDKTAIGNWETFIMLTLSDGKVAFRTRTGKFLQAASGGGSSVNCKGEWLKSYERWSKTENSDGTFSFAANNGKYMVSESNGDLNANRSAIGSWEKFSVIDLGAAGMDAQPDVKIQFDDLTGDGHEEMLLMMTQEDGRGFIMADPLGMFDTLDKLGYGQTNGTDYWDALSPTQRGTLRQQLNSSGVSYGQVIDGNELRAFLGRLPAGGTRTYATTEFEQVIDVTAISVGACDSTGNFCTSASVGEFDILISDNGFEAAVTVASISASAGPLTVTVSTGSLQAAAYVDNNGFAIGGQVTLIGVETGLGKEDGSYVGIGVAVSAGFYVDAKWGRNDQYGFTLDLPVFPVSVAVYVKGSDAVWLWDEVSGWTVGAADTVADGAVLAWNECVDWADMAGDNISMAVSESYNDTKSTLQVAGNDVVAAVSDASSEVVQIYTDASSAIASTVEDIGDAVTDAANGVADAVEDFATDVADTGEDVVDAVGSFFKSLF